MNSNIEFFSKTHQVFEENVEKELAFENNINYFYGLFFERCAIYKSFILQKIKLYKLDYDKVFLNINLIHSIRTYKNHTLNNNNKEDEKKIICVEEWHYNLTGSKEISDSKYSIERAIDLNSKADIILNSILKCVEKIDIDKERRNDIIEEMLILKREYLPDYIIEEYFNKTLNKVGIVLDAKKLTKIYGCKIREKIKLNSENTKIENIELWIEDILFLEKIVCCPLGADRIMSEFGLEAGKEVGKLKEIAVKLYNKNKFLSEEELLNQLKERLNQLKELINKIC